MLFVARRCEQLELERSTFVVDWRVEHFWIFSIALSTTSRVYRKCVALVGSIYLRKTSLTDNCQVVLFPEYIHSITDYVYSKNYCLFPEFNLLYQRAQFPNNLFECILKTSYEWRGDHIRPTWVKSTHDHLCINIRNPCGMDVTQGCSPRGWSVPYTMLDTYAFTFSSSV